MQTVAVPPSVDVQEWMHEAGWSDGMPLVAPTTDRVARMMLGTQRSAIDRLGLVPPMYGVATVERVAACAVMAGVEASAFRVVLAATEALCSDAFNAHGVCATTSGATPVVIVSGPAVEEARINSRHGALGSGTRANGSVGRAIRLVMHHIGGNRIGATEMTTLGSSCKWGMCIAEADDELRGWEPYHTTQHIKQPSPPNGDSTATVFAVTSGGSQLFDFKTESALGVCQLMASMMAQAYAPHVPMINEALLVVSPEHVGTLRDGGVKSKAELAAALFHLSNRELGRQLSSTLLLAKPGVIGMCIGHFLRFLAAVSSFVGAVLLILAPKHWQQILPIFSFPHGRIIPKFSSPSSFHIVAAGAPAGKFSVFFPGFGYR